jgi:hypothetical protein
MHISRAKWPSKNGKVYESIYLRHSYREGGKVQKRNIANLKHFPPQVITAIELALKNKGNLAVLRSLKEVELKEGLSVGSVWTVYEVGKALGITRALGAGVAGKLALWQVIARVIDQGSRLSAVRLAQVHAACDVLGIQRGFDENDLYENLTWVCLHQERIERRLFLARRGGRKPELFLYDVTSSYLEGQKNALGAFGYSRDAKKGKKQIVIGLLCDEAGEPVSTEVFQGNTQDFGSQVKKLAERFGCRRVTVVGDRGMIKSAGIEEISRAGFHYITAITKPEIMTLLRTGVLQLELFDASVCEVEDEAVRYILRRNRLRAEEMANKRADKLASVERFIQKQNAYLLEHPRARVSSAQKWAQQKIAKLQIETWLSVMAAGRTLSLKVDEAALHKASQLDGCYVIKTDVPREVAHKEVIHHRYKDLAHVEQAFRTCKSAHLEVRPVHVRTEAHTRGHVLVVMLAYLVRRELSRAWGCLDLTVEEGLEQLKTLCSMEMNVEGGGCCLRIPTPRPQSRALLQALGISLPEVLPHTNTRVGTRKKLLKRRK